MRPCLTHPFSISRSEKRALSSLCQAKETGDVGPSLEDVLFMITEDVLDFDSAEGCSTGRRHRALREARRDHAHSSLVTLRITHSHPSARGLRLIAPRTHHLRFNHFARPPRRRRTETCSSVELLDGLSLRGGYIFLQLESDASKRDISDMRGFKPLELLSESDFFTGKSFFGNNAATSTSFVTSILI